MKKKKHVNFMKIWRVKRDEMLIKSVNARKTKKTRLKRVKKLIKQKILISIDDFILTSIENPEVFWKTNDITWQAKMTKKKEAKRRKEYKKNEDVGTTNREQGLCEKRLCYLPSIY